MECFTYDTGEFVKGFITDEYGYGENFFVTANDATKIKVSNKLQPPLRVLDKRYIIERADVILSWLNNNDLHDEITLVREREERSDAIMVLAKTGGLYLDVIKGHYMAYKKRKVLGLSSTDIQPGAEPRVINTYLFVLYEGDTFITGKETVSFDRIKENAK